MQGSTMNPSVPHQTKGSLPRGWGVCAVMGLCWASALGLEGPSWGILGLNLQQTTAVVINSEGALKL